MARSRKPESGNKDTLKLLAETGRIIINAVPCVSVCMSAPSLVSPWNACVHGCVCVSVCVCVRARVRPSLPQWWSHSLSLISICHFIPSHSGVDDEKNQRKGKGMDEDDRLSSVESTSRPLCAPDLISLTVQVKWRELDKSGEGGGGGWVGGWVGGRDKLCLHPTITGN